MKNAIELHRLAGQNALQAIGVEAQSEGFNTSDRLDFRTLLTTLRRRMSLFLGVLGTVIVATVIFTAMQPRQYSTSAQVVLNMREEHFAPGGDDQRASPTQENVAETEAQVIKSRELAGTVADRLNLVSDPTFNPAFQPHVGKIKRIALALHLASPPPMPRVTPDAARSAAIGQLLNNLTVLRVGLTNVIDIRFTAASPLDAQRIANEYARQYTQMNVVQKRTTNTAATTFLAGRLNELQAQAQADTARVQEYRIAHNLLSTSGASLTEQEISNFSQQVAQARTQAVEDQARLATARSQVRGGSAGDDVGESLNSQVVGALRARKAIVSGEVANLNARYGPRHPDVLKAQSELNDIDAQISAEIKRVISNLDAKAEVSQQRLASISGSLGGARGALASNNRDMIGLDGLNRRAEASQALYESYLVKFKERAAEEGTELPNSRVISFADLPSVPTGPRIMLNLVLAIVLGTGLGLAAAFGAELMFNGLTTGADVESRLNLPYLGAVPLLKSVLPKIRSPMAAVVQAPTSAFAEAFRGLRTSLHYSCSGAKQVLLITSAIPKEGKTTISTCLARLSAVNGERVVLVDVDVRHRGVSRMIRGQEEIADLITVLRGETTLDAALIFDEVSGAHILPTLRSVENLGDLLIGQEMDALLAQLRERFDLVILDSAPVLPIADTRALAAKVDAVVMVAKWRATPDHAVRAALNLLPHHVVPIAGLVLSQVDVRKQVKFGSGDAHHYYDQYKEYYA